MKCGQRSASPVPRPLRQHVLRRLLGDTVSTGSHVSLTSAGISSAGISSGGISIGADLAALSSALSLTVTPGTALAGGLGVGGSVQVSSQGAWSGSFSIGPAATAGGFALPVVDLELDGGKATVALNFSPPLEGLPSRVVLVPPPSAGQIAGVGALIVEAAAAATLQALVSTLRDQVSAASRSQADTALELVGLLSGSGPNAAPCLPFGLTSDPAGFARQVLGDGAQLDPDRVARLVDAVRAALGLASAPHGALPLAAGVQLTAGAGPGGDLQLSLALATTAPTSAAQVQLGLTVPHVGAVAPQFGATLGPPGGAMSLQLALGSSGLTALLHTSTGDVPLLPTCPGLGSLAQAAGQEALPFLLTNLESSGPAPLPAVLAGIRSALGLGNPNFDANELRTLCANPASELVRRLSAAGPGGLTDLAQLLPTLPAPWGLNTAASIEVSYGKQSLKVDLSGNPAVFTLDAWSRLRYRGRPLPSRSTRLQTAPGCDASPPRLAWTVLTPSSSGPCPWPRSSKRTQELTSPRARSVSGWRGPVRPVRKRRL